MNRNKHSNKPNISLVIYTIIAIAIIALFISHIKGSEDPSLRASTSERSNLNPPIHQPPVLTSLIVHPETEENYFDFILDSGSQSEVSDVASLKPTARKLINFFFLGLTLPSEDFWVNLNPVQPEKITSPRLSATDIGKVLLAADLRLKKDTALLTDPRTPTGKEYWSILNQKLKEKGLPNSHIPGLSRVWIIPAKVVVKKDLIRHRVDITQAKLKVCLETEYLSSDNSSLRVPTEGRDEAISTNQALLDCAAEAMKQAILPALEYKVNYSKSYAPLRQVYYSLILYPSRILQA